MSNPLDIDPYMSGRYLIRKIHHRISTPNDIHTMNLECVKDAVRVPYPEENSMIQRENERMFKGNTIWTKLKDKVSLRLPVSVKV